MKKLLCLSMTPWFLLGGCDYLLDVIPETGTAGDSSPGDTSSDSEDTSAQECDAGWTGDACDRCLIHVNGSDGDDSFDGRSWSQALATVSEALTRAADEECEVWVAAGTYFPTTGPQANELTFQLEEGVDLYGGFAGGETSRDERDVSMNPTTLSGALPPGTPSSVYHVVTGANGATIDGFSVTGGVAVWPHTDGGGMLNEGVSPTVRNCTFEANTAEWMGAGMANRDGAAPVIVDSTFINNNGTYAGAIGNDSGAAPVIVNTRFIRNYALEGAAIQNIGSAATVIGSIFFQNQAVYGAGAISNVGESDLTLINSTVVGNTCQSGPCAGGLYNFGSVATLVNDVLWGNAHDLAEDSFSNHACASSEICNAGMGTSSAAYSLIDGGCAASPETACGAGNLAADPELTDIAAGDLRPLSTSPLLDAGDNAALPADSHDLDGDGDVSEATPLDIDRSSRVANGTVDIGAYETAVSSL